MTQDEKNLPLIDTTDAQVQPEVKELTEEQRKQSVELLDSKEHVL